MQEDGKLKGEDFIMTQFVGKDRYVKKLFSSIASSYDTMNLVMTWGLLPIWQKKMLKKANLKSDDKALDVCCGTGELTIKLSHIVGQDGQVIGLDFCPDMLEVGNKKIATNNLKGIKFVQGDALSLPFPNNSFAAVTNGYALRNVVDIKKAISEMARVAKPGGKVICLEASRPKNFFIRQGFDLYFFKIVPLLGKIIDKGKSIDDRYPAYTWLPESLKMFPSQDKIKEIFEEVGLKEVKYYNLLGGASTIYVGTK